MDEFRKTVTDLIEKIPVEGMHMPDGLADLARQIGVLPVAWDIGGCVAVTPAGEVVSWVWEEEDRRSTELGVIERHRALFQGAAKFPPLRNFVPSRPADARVCSGCRGSGRPIGIPDTITGVVCKCGGAGWLPTE